MNVRKRFHPGFVTIVCDQGSGLDRCSATRIVITDIGKMKATKPSEEPYMGWSMSPSGCTVHPSADAVKSPGTCKCILGVEATKVQNRRSGVKRLFTPSPKIFWFAARRLIAGALRHARLALLTLAFSVGSSLPSTADEWSFRLAPYVWLTGLEGDVATLPGAPKASVSFSFRELVEKIDFAAFVAGEARNGDFFLRSEFSFASLSQDATTPGTAFSTADLRARTIQGALLAGWSFYEDDTIRADVFAGARLWNVNTRLKLRPGLQPGRIVESNETFVDPVIGLSGKVRVAPDWTLAASASVGGIAFGADVEYGLTLAAFWDAGENWGVAAGYRYLAVDYEKGAFVFDVAQHGPYLGVFFDF